MKATAQALQKATQRAFTHMEASLNPDKDAAGGRQVPNSRQSGRQGVDKSETGKAGAGEKSRAGIGSSQGQDSGSPDERERRPSGGTADIERGGGDGDVERGASSGASLVGDPTGAYKERP